MTDKKNEVESPFGDEDPFPGLEQELDALMRETEQLGMEEAETDEAAAAAEEAPELPAATAEPSKPEPADQPEPDPFGNDLLDEAFYQAEPAMPAPARVRPSQAPAAPSVLILILGLLLLSAAIASTAWVLEERSGLPFLSDSNQQHKAIIKVQKPANQKKRFIPGTTTTSQEPKPAAVKPAPSTPDSTKEAPGPKQEPGTGSHGAWMLNIASLAGEPQAQAYLGQLEMAGISNAEISPTKVKDKIWYRVRISGLASKEAAQEQKARLEKQLSLTGAWFSKE